MKNILIIIENEMSFPNNCFFDESIIQKRIKENDFDMIFELIFSKRNCNKLLAFREIKLYGKNKFDQRFFSSNEYRENIGEFDFTNILKSNLTELNVESIKYYCGYDIGDIYVLQRIVKCKFIPINPFDLFDKDVYLTLKN